ncbi:hypothetical protein TWF481_005880 [Arthrobotrys musiformis]|uniref:Uncharacterized protein n=1 Tax=Arthrobotrys musiformis TaxID=47236 RepID=A0AAV9WKU3_9PEZI
MDRSHYIVSLLLFYLIQLHGRYAEGAGFPPFSALPDYYDLSSPAQNCVDSVFYLNITSCSSIPNLDQQYILCLCSTDNFGDNNAPSYPEGGSSGVFWDCCPSYKCAVEAKGYLNLYCDSVDFSAFTASIKTVSTTTTTTIPFSEAPSAVAGPPVMASTTSTSQIVNVGPPVMASTTSTSQIIGVGPPATASIESTDGNNTMPSSPESISETTTSKPTAAVTETPKPSHSVGWTVGIGVGASAGGIAVIVLTWSAIIFFVRKHKNGKHTTDVEGPPSQSAVSTTRLDIMPKGEELDKKGPSESSQRSSSNSTPIAGSLKGDRPRRVAELEIEDIQRIRRTKEFIDGSELI